MAWASVGDRGLTGSNSAASSITHTITTANVTAGNVLVVSVVMNNRSAAEGNTNDITSVSDSGGNSYTKLYEWTNANGAQNNGSTTAMFASKIATGLTSGSSTITANFSGSSSANVIGAWEFSFGAGSTFSKAGQATGDVDANATGPSVTLGSLSSQSYLWLSIDALEGLPADTYTKDADYTMTNSGGTPGASDDAQQTLRASYRIFTGTTDTHAATNSAAQDWTSILVALAEVTSGGSTDLWVEGPNHGVVSTQGGGLLTGMTTTGSSTITTSATNVPGGGSAYCWVHDAVAAACWSSSSLSTTDNFAILQGWFRFDVLPVTGECSILGFGTAAGVVGQVVYTASDAKLKVRIGSVGAAMTTTVAAGTTYRLDLRYQTSGTTWTLDGWIDGADQTTQTSAQAASSTVNALRRGPTGTPTCTLRLANIYVKSTSTNPTGPMNAMRVKGSSPGSDGTHAVGSGAFKDDAGTTLNNTTTTAWQRLDDVPLSGTAEWIEQTVVDTGGYMDTNIADTSETTIIAARAIVGYHAGGSAKSSIFSSATESIVYSGSMNVAGTLTYRQTIITPSAAWTSTIYNALKARIGYASAVGTTPKWDDLMVEYAYEPSTTTNVNDSDSFTVTDAGTSPGSGVSGIPTFVESGLGGGGFQNVVTVNPAGTILLSGGDVAAVHISYDDGISWEPAFRGLTSKPDTNIAAVAFDPNLASTAYFLAGPGSGLWRSDDIDTLHTWTKVFGSIEVRAGNVGPNTIGLPEKHPRPTGQLIRFGGTSTTSGWNWIYCASYNDGIYRSGNGGADMARIVGTSNSNIYTRALAVDTAVDTTLYAGARATTAGTGGLYRVINANGATSQNATAPSWAKMTTPFNSVEEVATVGSSTTCRVYVTGSILAFDATGGITSRSDGVWTASDPTGTTSAEWTRLGATALDTAAQWEGLEVYKRTGQPDVLYVGCGDSVPVGDGTWENLYRSMDAGLTWTRMATSTADVHDTLGGAGGETYWNIQSGAAPFQKLGVGGPNSSTFVVAQIVSNPADRSKVYLSGRGCIWLSRNATAADPDWYPSASGLGVTINPQVFSDPNTAGRVYITNTDWVFFYSTDNGDTITMKKPSIPGVPSGDSGSSFGSWLDTSTTPATFYIGASAHQSNTASIVWKNTNPVTQAWTEVGDRTANPPTGFNAISGGTRPMGMGGRNISTVRHLLVNTSGGGIYHWTGTAWEVVHGPVLAADPSVKRSPVIWAADALAYVYSPTSGLWRGTTTTTTMDTWDQIWTQQSPSRGTAHMVVDPNNTARVFVSVAAGLYRLDNAATGAAVGSGITATKITNITEPGPVGYDPNGFFYCWEQSPTATLKRTSNPSGTAPSWTDVADDTFRDWGQFPEHIDLASSGFIYVAGEGTGALVGTNATTSVLTVSDTDTFTFTDAETVVTSSAVVNDDDTFTFSETESAAVTMSDADSFAVSETQSNPGGVAATGPPPPPDGPRVRHVIRSPQGSVSPVVGNMQTDEQAPGGFWSASGEVTADVIAELPGVFTAGATWQVWADDELLWEGHLLDPVVADGVAKLSGRGWGWLAQRNSGRMLFASRTYADWVSADSDPFDLNVSESYAVASDGGKLQWTARKGDDVDLGRQAGLIFYADGSAVTSVAGTLEWNGAGSTNQVFQVEAAKWPGNLSQQGANITISDGGTFDRNVSTEDADLVRLRVQRVDGPTTFSNTFRLSVKDLRVRGIASGDSYQSADVVREVMSRLGIDDFEVSDTGDDILPLDHKDGTFADLLDYASLYCGLPWLIMSTGPRRFARLREGETYFTTRAMGETSLIPVTRYNRVVITWDHVNGRSRQSVATAEDIDVADPYDATGYINTLTVAISEPQHNDDLPTALARRLLAKVITERFTGTLGRTWVEDRNGSLVPATLIRPGDRIIVSDGKPDASITVDVSRKSFDGITTRLDLAQDDLTLDRWLRRQQARGTFSL